MSSKLEAHGPEYFLSPRIQEDFLEHHAALLARRHISDTRSGRDTSFDVFQLTMAHADLVYWRGLQSQDKRAPKGNESTIKVLVDLVSADTTRSAFFTLRQPADVQSSPSLRCWKVSMHLLGPLTSLSPTSPFFGKCRGNTSRRSAGMSTPSSTRWDSPRWSSIALSRRTTRRRMRHFWRRQNKAT